MGNAAAMVKEALAGRDGWDEEAHRALIAPDLSDGRSAHDALLEKRAKAAAGKR